MTKKKLNWISITQAIIVATVSGLLLIFLPAAARMRDEVRDNTAHRVLEVPEVKKQMDCFDVKLDGFDNKIDSIRLEQAIQRTMLKGYDDKLDILIEMERNR